MKSDLLGVSTVAPLEVHPHFCHKHDNCPIHILDRAVSRMYVPKRQEEKLNYSLRTLLMTFWTLSCRLSLTQASMSHV